MHQVNCLRVAAVVDFAPPPGPLLHAVQACRQRWGCADAQPLFRPAAVAAPTGKSATLAHAGASVAAKPSSERAASPLAIWTAHLAAEALSWEGRFQTRIPSLQLGRGQDANHMYLQLRTREKRHWDRLNTNPSRHQRPAWLAELVLQADPWQSVIRKTPTRESPSLARPRLIVLWDRYTRLPNALHVLPSDVAPEFLGALGDEMLARTGRPSQTQTIVRIEELDLLVTCSERRDSNGPTHC